LKIFIFKLASYFPEPFERAGPESLDVEKWGFDLTAMANSALKIGTKVYTISVI
jgi:hypothetical protein